MKKVFLGVGHGGADPGAVANGFKEKDLNLAIALSCRDELERHGVMVLMSRIKDENDPVADEIKEANAFKPDIAVDIHNNAGGGDGFEAYYQIGNATSKQLSESVQSEVIAVGQNSRGIKTRAQSDGQDYYGFLRQIRATAVLCEFAFLDNAKDIQIIDTPEEQRAMGVALAKGLLKYLGIVWKAEGLKEWCVCVGKFTSEEKALEYAKIMGVASVKLI